MAKIGAKFITTVKAKAGKVEQRLLAEGVRAAYKAVMREWPVYTGYSKANNRISVTGQPIRRLEPATRPTVPGALAGKAAQVETTELAKLDQLETNKTLRNRTILIGNSAPYSSNVGFRSGRGLEIFKLAAAEGRAVIRALRRK